MFSRISLSLAGATLLSLVGTAGEIQPLWPEGKMPASGPDQVAAPLNEVEAPGFDRNAHRMPYLEWEPAPAESNRTGACVILISGGGYACTCDGPAFQPLKHELMKAGVQCVWLWYRNPTAKGTPNYATAWADGQRAVRLVREAAASRGFDPERIGTLGCSAGSHLSVLLGTSSQTPAYAPVDATDELPCHINWAIPMCPAYVLSDGLTDANSAGGEGVTMSDAFKFDARTCSMCFFHGGRDPYSPLGSTALYRKLRTMGVPAELHLLADRGHGPVDAASFGRAIEYMRQMGFLGPLAPEVDVMERFASDADRASYEREDVWPEGKMPDVQTNQCTPYIEWHLPKELRTKAIQVIYSGGAYIGNGPESFEVTPVRRYLNARGMAVVTLCYRTPRPEGMPKHVTAWQDLQRAIRIVRAGAERRGLDPNRIGLMGSSAGGHLTLMGALSSHSCAYHPIDELDKLPCHVQLGVGIYPAYVLTDGADGRNAHGGNRDEDVLVDELAFDRSSCPMVFVHGDADGYAAMGSVRCWEELRRRGVQCDLHTLALRNHCFGQKASPGTGSYTYCDRIWEFMTKKGFNK